MECIQQKPDGSFCGRKVKKDSEYCHYHHKKRNELSVPETKKGMSKLLGLKGDEAMSYDAFYAQQRPHELHNELFQLRALLVAYRKAYDTSSEEIKENFLDSVTETAESYLVYTLGMTPDKAERVVGYIIPAVGDAYDEHLESLHISGDYVKQVSVLIKDTAWVAEKAVKIKDGITLNVKVATQEFLDFIQDVVFTVVTDSQTRAEIAQAAMAYFGRNSVTSVNVIDADFEEKE